MRYALAATLAGASVVTACGSQHAGANPGTAGSSASGTQTAVRCSAAPHGHTLTLTGKDNGKALCVRQGTELAIYLQGTATRRWSPIRAASPALQPVANGRLMLRLGVTGAFFRAARPGVTSVTSSLPSCGSPGTAGGGNSTSGGGSGTAGGTATTGPRCRMGTVWHVTFVITR